MYKIGCLEGSGVPVLYIGRTFPKVKGVSPTRFGTSVPSSGKTKCQFKNQLLIISCYSQGSSVCSGAVC